MEEKKKNEILRTSAPYMTLGLQLASAIIVFYFIGVFADDYFGTKPWLMVAGMTIGFVGGMIQFFRTVIELSDKEDNEQRKH